MSMFRGQMNVCLGFAATKNVVTVTEEIKLFPSSHRLADIPKSR